MKKELKEIVSEHPFFDGMDPAFVSLVAGCGQLAAYGAGALLAQDGGAADEFFLVREGRIALEITPPGRDAFVIETLAQGEVLGWSWLFEPHVWQFNARALEPVRVIRFDGACLRTKCDDDAELGYELMKRFVRVLVERFMDTRLQLMDLYGSAR